MKTLTPERPVVRTAGDRKDDVEVVEEPVMIGIGRCTRCSCPEYQAGGPSSLHCADCGHAVSEHVYK